jgi:tRNA pseudouridine32 synthase/23S rRNA pseudouridine746 synthase/23S rRNA pseudouridine1911/1915/1917 synthase
VKSSVPKRHQPKGFKILYEDQDIIVGNKAPGFLTVAANYDRVHTIHYALNQYVRKGNARSRKCVYVVHRLDRETSGILIFAKSERVKDLLKAQWKVTHKKYYAVVHGKLANKEGVISSYLVEDDDYCVRSTQDQSKGRLSHTAYRVLKETKPFSLLEIDLLTGRKNQIRIHLAELHHPVVGDKKYGRNADRFPFLALHARSISLPHPHSGKEIYVEAEIPQYFIRLTGPLSCEENLNVSHP